ncbi:MAG: DUF892 family protein [Flavobacterium sp. JAD_PAG50586_2]|nr:MAG: DUF892 family protein [Flavobacterium sp. JAD_PAG50586_2]
MKTKTITTLHHLLNDELSTLLCTEIRLTELLPAWIDKTHNLILKNLLRDYQHHVKHHADNLKTYGLPETEGMYDLPERFTDYYLSEITSKIEDCSPEILDAFLLASIQTVNHIKISCYGTAATWAQLLELQDISLLLHDAVINEKHTNERLGELARHDINSKALAPFAITQ